MQIKLLTEGGNLTPGPGLSQKLGPAGLNLNQVIQKVNEATKEFQGLKVPVEINVNTSDKSFDVKVSSPPVSGLLKKELGIEKGSGNQKKMNSANASIEQIISVAKAKFPDMLSKNLKSAVKTVVGTCTSLGVIVESKSPQEVEKEIDEGKYDKEINSESTETPSEKRESLDKFFNEVKSKQELLIKQEQAAAAAKAAEAPAATPAAGEEAKVPEKTEGAKK